MLHIMLTRTVFFMLGAVGIACGGGSDVSADSSAGSLMTFDTAHIRLVSKKDTIPLVVELARTPAQKTMGLMERTELAEDAGMLFLYGENQPGTAGYWMFRTKIPLDIAFMDSTGAIRAIRNMAPCTTATAGQCPTYNADVPYRATLEVNGGFFAKKGVGLGDRVILADTVRK
jgi:uncharacterized membrane protein (UPF0127 family)